MTWLARLTWTAGPAERDQHFRADPLSVLMGPAARAPAAGMRRYRPR